MPIWTLAKKEMRVLLRDRMATIVLLGLPIVFILVLGLLLGESFGQKSDERVRVSVVDLDIGLRPQVAAGAFGAAAAPGGSAPLLAATVLAAEGASFPGEPWSRVVMRDLAETGGIKVEVIPTLEEAKRLIDFRKRAAVLVFRPEFSANAARCSFLADGVNPFHRDGVHLNRVGVEVLKDNKQPAQAAVVEQVAQVSLLRVLLPWMIGAAFEKLSEDRFINMLGTKVNLPVPQQFQFLLRGMGVKPDPKTGHVQLNDLLRVAASGSDEKMKEYRDKVGEGVQAALSEQFKNFDLTGKTWASLTRSRETVHQEGAGPTRYHSEDGQGFLKRGAQRYQTLVPAYTVMFAFFLVLNVGSVFVTERREGTLKRLRAAPLTRGQILLGKLVPYFLLSLGQGAFLLLCGRLLFGLRWGPPEWPWWQQVACLAPVVFTTSLAAMGLAVLVAAVARTEIQVALYGAVPVLVLALIGGCVLPRELMPEQAQSFALLTPQGWALDAYRELLGAEAGTSPNLTIVFRACGVLAGFGVAFIGLAWGLLRLD